MYSKVHLSFQLKAGGSGICIHGVGSWENVSLGCTVSHIRTHLENHLPTSLYPSSCPLHSFVLSTRLVYVLRKTKTHSQTPFIPSLTDCPWTYLWMNASKELLIPWYLQVASQWTVWLWAQHMTPVVTKQPWPLTPGGQRINDKKRFRTIVDDWTFINPSLATALTSQNEQWFQPPGFPSSGIAFGCLSCGLPTGVERHF